MTLVILDKRGFSKRLEDQISKINIKLRLPHNFLVDFQYWKTLYILDLLVLSNSHKDIWNKWLTDVILTIALKSSTQTHRTRNNEKEMFLLLVATNIWTVTF